MSNGPAPMCVGRQCEFHVDTVNEEVLCETGVGTCTDATLLEANISKFHDQSLSDATGKINEVLSSIPKDPDGRQLSFLFTNQGIMLAWVRHGIVSRHDDEATMSKALGVKS